MAKAIMHIPQILFLDEPTTGLDPQSRRAIWEYLIELQKDKGFTIFLTTQYLEEAEVCDRISIIDRGQILVTDTPGKLKREIGQEFDCSQHGWLHQELKTKKVLSGGPQNFHSGNHPAARPKF